MVTKTHITAQEEGVEEIGLQIRNTEPSSPVEKTAWLNTDQNKIKLFTGGVKRVLALGSPAQKILTNNIIDCENHEVFLSEISANESYTLQNLTEGKIITLFVTNTGASVITVSFNENTFTDLFSSLNVGVSKTVQFTLIKADSKLFVSSSEFNS